MKFDPKKFLSRKFITAIIGIIVGLAVSFGCSDSDIGQIAGMVTSIASAVSYIFGEASVDIAAVKAKNALNAEDRLDDDMR